MGAVGTGSKAIRKPVWGPGKAVRGGRNAGPAVLHIGSSKTRPLQIAMSTREPYQPLRLVLVAIGSFYVLFTAGIIHREGPFAPAGVDFRALFASAHIMVTSGFSQVYDLAVQKQVQTALVAPYGFEQIEPIPTPFLPLFIVPFCLLLPAGLLGGFIAWTILNFVILVGYLVRFVKDVQVETGEPTDRSLLPALALLSFPTFTNFLLGQVNVWLLVCMGEFIRAWEKGRPFRSGLWLGGMLLKPQILILVLPALILSGEWGAVGGFAFASAVVGMISLIIAGPGGIQAWGILLTHHAARLSSTDPIAMINLRMVSELLSLLCSLEGTQRIAVIVAIVVSLVTLLLSIRLRKRAPEEKSGVMVPLMTATLVATWHAHIHMAMALIPSLLHQVITGRMPRRLFVVWAILPSAVYILSLAFIALLNASGIQPPPLAGFTYPALALLILHIFMTVQGLRGKY